MGPEGFEILLVFIANALLLVGTLVTVWVRHKDHKADNENVDVTNNIEALKAQVDTLSATLDSYKSFAGMQDQQISHLTEQMGALREKLDSTARSLDITQHQYNELFTYTVKLQKFTSTIASLITDPHANIPPAPTPPSFLGV